MSDGGVEYEQEKTSQFAMGKELQSLHGVETFGSLIC